MILCTVLSIFFSSEVGSWKRDGDLLVLLLLYWTMRCWEVARHHWKLLLAAAAAAVDDWPKGTVAFLRIVHPVVSTRRNFHSATCASATCLHARARAVEQLDLKTGEIIESFSSIYKAAKATGAPHGAIRRVVQGELMSCIGYFWREEGSDALPSPNARGIPKTPVEKICPTSGEVLETFQSITDAERNIKQCWGSINSVLRGKSPSAGGFFWRKVGSHAKPPQDLKKKKKTIEKLSIESGQVLATYESITEAANSVGVSPSSLWCAVRGSTRTCRGFFWREKGSTALPSSKALKREERSISTKIHKSKVKPFEQVCLDSGDIVSQFDSPLDAAFAVNGSYSGIINVLKGRANSYRGFYYRYCGDDRLPSSEPKVILKPVEKICIDTNNVIAEYDSVAEAAHSENASYTGIRRVCEEKQTLCNGAFWRYRGSNRLPPATTVTRGFESRSKAVEMLSLETGEVLELFQSIQAASRSVNAPAQNVYSVLCGKTRSCRGFYFRYQGSSKTPPPPRARARKVEMLDITSGDILETFDSAKQAAYSLNASSPSNLYRAIHDKKKSFRGYFWRYEESDK